MVKEKEEEKQSIYTEVTDVCQPRRHGPRSPGGPRAKIMCDLGPLHKSAQGNLRQLREALVA